MKKIKIRERVTIWVHESELPKADEGDLDTDKHSEYNRAVKLAATKVAGNGGSSELVRVHHKWTGRNGIERSWRFVYLISRP